MHYHCEIIMPPTDDIESAVKTALDPFSTHLEGDERHEAAFIDWYVIGGRWHGQKIINRLSKETIDAFYDELDASGITVSGFRIGREEINPPDQIPAVDEIWKRHFNDTPFEKCPFFKHGADPYKDSTTFPGNVMPVMECRDVNGIARAVFVGTDGNVSFMCQDSVWNGVNTEMTQWNRSIGQAIDLQRDYIHMYRHVPDHLAKYQVADDWIAVTVDYHS